MTQTLPTYDLWDGHATSLDIHEPGWLLAGRMTDIDTGESWRFTYLSTWFDRGMRHTSGCSTSSTALCRSANRRSSPTHRCTSATPSGHLLTTPPLRLAYSTRRCGMQ